MNVLMILLLVLIISCAVCVAFTKNLLVAAVVFMTQSLLLSLVWILLQSPDLGITEAAVGAGVSSVLFMLTLRRIHTEDLRLEALEQEARKAQASMTSEPNANTAVKAAGQAGKEAAKVSETAVSSAGKTGDAK